MVANYEEKSGAAHVENTVGTTWSQYEPDDEMSVGRYLSTRFATLVPPRMILPPSPFKLLGLLTRRDWLFFGVSPNVWSGKYARDHQC